MNPYVILFIFISVAYLVLRWIQRRSQFVHLPKLSEGQWHPLLANYTWKSENKFKEEFNRLKQDPAPNNTALVQVLMKRAMHDVAQIREMQEQKQTLQQLVRSGSIGEEIWSRFQHAEQLLNAECEQVCACAEELKQGWAQTIFQQANQMLMLEQKRAGEMEMKKVDEDRKAQQKWELERQAQEKKDREESARRAADELIKEEQEEAKKSGKKNKRI